MKEFVDDNSQLLSNTEMARTCVQIDPEFDALSTSTAAAHEVVFTHESTLRFIHFHSITVVSKH